GVELVVAERVLTREELEVSRGREGEQGAGAPAHGAIASNDLGDVLRDVEADLAAVTGARVRFRIAHRVPLWSAPYSAFLSGARAARASPAPAGSRSVRARSRGASLPPGACAPLRCLPTPELTGRVSSWEGGRGT